MLYLVVDLGDRPQLDHFRDQVGHLATLAGAADSLTSMPRKTGGRLESTYVDLKRPVQACMKIVRTSLASPWVTILADVARTSSPVAYTATGLFALHR